MPGGLIIMQIRSYRQSINPSLNLITDGGFATMTGGLIIMPCHCGIPSWANHNVMDSNFEITFVS